MQFISKIKISIFIFFISIFFIPNKINGQTTTTKNPKLVVGIVVDQMAYEFLYRYADHYSNAGFKKLLNEGFSCENTYYNYIPTYTGPGHASIYTGTVPSIHGIVSNDWYDRKTMSNKYCASDPSVSGVGNLVGTATGNMSPVNMLTTTICDELRLFNQMHSKVIGIALKDRGAILPAGHTGNAAYWYDGNSNAWITSSYYMQSLPDWVQKFNEKNLASTYLSQPWNLSTPLIKYKNSTTDSTSWEGLFTGETAPKFPHKFSGITNTEVIKATPYGNTFTIDFAKETIEKEGLGKDLYTDFLALSFSSTDYVGHRYGNYSLEIEDTYVRFDQDLANFIAYLNTTFGKENYLLFLTADHGVAPTPGYMQSLHIPSGFVFETELQNKMESYLDEKIVSGNWILSYSNQNIYLNDTMIEKSNKTIAQILSLLKPMLLNENGIANVFEIDALENATLTEKYKTMFIHGMHAKRSGDILIIYEPNWIDGYSITGSTHGAHYTYDSHVPLIWYGAAIKPGKTYRTIHITDIAATLAAILHLREPSGCIGEVITEIFE